MRIRGIIISSKGTSIISVAKLYQLVPHLNKVVFIHLRILIRKVSSSEILKLKEDDGKEGSSISGRDNK